jgi:ATP-dependent DNA helicase 2 subunit 2
MREACVQEEEPDQFNAFLRDLRQTYEDKRRDPFWKLIETTQLTLISSEETSESSVSPAEAAKVCV